ncbi:ribonuclease R [Acidisoma silvae]|uniref:Ribonuclease R n=1 Tax=Acidisoma silvae TaxID=2802396 RepID=A0A963YR72_9PROT|nr:ribonuclease R [Acidisoma silvae]MCB8875636.1 ribonuclease R [Acidisoma silvae]
MTKTARKKPKAARQTTGTETAPQSRPFPSREQLREFIAESTGRVGKREIARAFGLGPEHKLALRDVLRDMAHKGEAAPAGHRRFASPSGASSNAPGPAAPEPQAGRLSRRHNTAVPEAIIVEITGIDTEGDAIGRPVDWRGDGPVPTIFMQPEARGQAALAPGHRVLARIRPIGNAYGARKYEGRTLKRIEGSAGRVIGIFRRRGGLMRIEPTDRRVKAEWIVPAGEDGGAQDGEIVRGEPLPMGGLGLKPARVTERLGDASGAKAVSLLVIATLNIPDSFTAEVMAEAEHARGVSPDGREDLRQIPLITIDGADARDFDDAVFAEPDGDGFRLIVAIADVSHYVTPGSALDRSARERGNSVYFPDRVVPMLPEALSNGWCSLRPNEDRACLFAEMRIGPDGRKRAHRFGRGLMRSAARMTYEEVQETRNTGRETPAFSLDHLYGAYELLLGERQRRGTLDLDVPEWKVSLDTEGRVSDVSRRQRLDSHRLIEEFMVLANIAAAEELERLKRPCVYRCHAKPSDIKLDGLRTYLHGMSISLPAGDQIHPRDLDSVLSQVAGTEEAPLVNDAVLRSQSQAEYTIENIGHFGLALTRYAHFTSPIRRYADLIVHRSLIAGLGLGSDGLRPDDAQKLVDTCEHITGTERRAAQAERDAVDRYMAAFMADKVGCIFDARISGVTRFGLFVTLIDTGASGMIPLSALPDDFWMHDEATQSLNGKRSRVVFHLAQTVSVRLAEAKPVTGGLLFQMMMPGRDSRPTAPPAGGKPTPGKRPPRPAVKGKHPRDGAKKARTRRT